jgi:hypothetical protein
LKDPGALTAALGTLGYPGFAYLKADARPVNPACLVLEALKRRPLESRVVVALPWVLLKYRDLDWQWLLEQAKLHNLQNRLGFLVTVALRAAEHQGKSTNADVLSECTNALDDARLAREDTFGRLTEAERRYLKDERSQEARYWNMLTTLKPEHLRYVA